MRRQQPRAVAAIVVPQEAEEDVLGADAVVVEGTRLVRRTLEGSPAPARERDERGPELVLAAARDPLDGPTRLLETHPPCAQHLRSEPVLAAEDAEQEMLGANLPVPEAARLVPREIEGLSGFPSEPLHPSGG